MTYYISKLIMVTMFDIEQLLLIYVKIKLKNVFLSYKNLVMTFIKIYCSFVDYH